MIYAVAGICGLALAWYIRKKPDATCNIHRQHSEAVSGYIHLYARGHQTLAACHLKGLRPGLHGFHVHEYGDLSNGCASTCKHYNPDHTSHGGPTGPNRHKGDFGNIRADMDGSCRSRILADVRLHEIIGRAFIIHENQDDLGQGNDEESLKTGNAGARIACGIIRST